MKRLLLITLSILLSSCADNSSDVPAQHGPAASATQSGDSLRASGEQTAENLTRRYNNEISACRPFNPATAFECSGVLIRGTAHSTQYHSWNPNPDPRTTGVSSSFLRRDATFTNFYIYKNGFIFYPAQATPAGKKRIVILCFFPRDGASNVRDDQGCGQGPSGPTSRECQSQGINTAEQWVNHYKKYGSYDHMCGLNVRDTLGENAVIAFNEGLKAQRLVFDVALDNYNEVRMAKWEQNIGDVLPIEAFFYLDDVGKVGAQYDQKDFLNQTGISLPIIFIRLSTTQQDPATFRFIAEDQAIPLD